MICLSTWIMICCPLPWRRTKTARGNYWKIKLSVPHARRASAKNYNLFLSLQFCTVFCPVKTQCDLKIDTIIWQFNVKCFTCLSYMQCIQLHYIYNEYARGDLFYKTQVQVAIK